MHWLPSQAKQKFVFGWQPTVEPTDAVAVAVVLAVVVVDGLLVAAAMDVLVANVALGTVVLVGVVIATVVPLFMVESGWQVRPRLAVPRAV